MGAKRFIRIVVIFLLYCDNCQNGGAIGENRNKRIDKRIISKQNKNNTQVLESD